MGENKYDFFFLPNGAQNMKAQNLSIALFLFV